METIYKLLRSITTALYVAGFMFVVWLVTPSNIDFVHAVLLSLMTGFSCSRSEPSSAPIVFVIMEALTLTAGYLALSPYGVVFAVCELAVMRAHAYYNLFAGNAISIMMLITVIFIGFIMFSCNLDFASSIVVAFALFVGGVIRIGHSKEDKQ